MAKEIKALSKTHGDKVVLVDDEDYDMLMTFKWRVSKCGYAVSQKSRLEHPEYKQKFIRMHRLIMNVENTDYIVDHINHNTFDNRKNNLRIVTPQQNTFNRKIKNKLGVKNVQKVGNKYSVSVWYNNKKNYHGTYQTFEEAKNIAEKITLQIQGEFACFKIK